jgi:hypothetical protein
MLRGWNLRTLHALALICSFAVLGPALGAPAVHRLLVRVETGAQGAAAGATVELRLVELGHAERRLPLAAGAPWPAGSTRTVPVTLSEPLDPDAVSRYSIYYKSPASAAQSSWEIASASVAALSADGRERPLGAPIQGLIRREGEIASAERAVSSLSCVTDADCDDGRMCNGRERCDPGNRGANARGCVAGVPMACPTNQVCMERLGCRGMDARDAATTPNSGGPKAAPSPAVTESLPAATPAVQSCNGKDVTLTEASGASRMAQCPAGTTCVAQPNGTGICAPAR